MTTESFRKKRTIMARIVYGVSGQGFGHATRSKEIIRHLLTQGHRVLILTYGQGLVVLPSAEWDEKVEILSIPGLGLKYQNNRLVYWRTIFDNARRLVKHSKEWQKILARCREFSPDFFLTDFEPLSAILAKTLRRPLVSVDNQHQLTNTRVRAPLKFYFDLLLDRAVIRSMVWGADYYLVTSFFKTPTKKKNIFVLPPVVRQEVACLPPAKGDYFLVYQGSDLNYLEKIIAGRSEKFVIFNAEQEETRDNLEFKKFDFDALPRYLAGCRAVIGTAGASLISESLHLKKPYLALPIDRQAEQMLNAWYLKKIGVGDFCRRLNEESLNKFISDLPRCEEKLRTENFLGNDSLFAKLDEIIAELS